MAKTLVWSTYFWAAGTLLGILIWMLGFGSTRYANLWQGEDDDRPRATFNLLQTFGLVATIIALALFLTGALCLANGIYSLGAKSQ